MRQLVSKRARYLALPMLVGATLAWCAAVHAQTQTTLQNEGLRTRSPPAVRDDPTVKRCRQLAARRADPTIGDSITTGVETAAMMFNLEPVFDAVATCRAALARYPSEPDVIIAHYNASEALSALALGLKFPDSEAAAFEQVLQE